MADDEGWETAKGKSKGGPKDRPRGLASARGAMASRGGRGGGAQSSQHVQRGGDGPGTSRPSSGPQVSQAAAQSSRTAVAAGRGGGGGGGGSREYGRGDFCRPPSGSGGPSSRGEPGRGAFVPSRGRATEFRTLNLRFRRVQVSLENKSHGGWKKCSEFIEDVSLPPRPADAADIGRRANLVLVNYFKTTVNLPLKLRHYQVYISNRRSGGDLSKQVEDLQLGGDGDKDNGNAKFPLDVRVGIADYLIRELESQFKEFSGKSGIAGVITDFMDAMYAAEEIDKHCKMEYDIPGSQLGPEADTTQVYHVQIRKTAEVLDTRDISKIINDMKGKEAPPNMVDVERIYNILLRCYERERFTPVGRTSLVQFVQDGGTPLGKGLVSYNGYSLNHTLTGGWKPYLNVEVANAACIPYTWVLKYFGQVIARPRFDPTDVRTWREEDLDEINKCSRGIKISYCRGIDLATQTEEEKGAKQKPSILNGKIQEVLWNSVQDEKFMYGDPGKEREISIKEFAERNYTDPKGIKIRLQYPNGPCLKLQGGRLRVVPAELCKIVKGQSFNRRLDEAQTSKMIDVARLNPDKLYGRINAVVEDLKLNQNPLAKKYGVTVDTKMLQLHPRVLPAPEIIYGKGQGVNASKSAVVKPQNGIWDSWKGEDFEFFQPASVKKWAILRLTNVQDRLFSHLIQKLVFKANSKGLALPRQQNNPMERRLDHLKDNHSKEHRDKNMPQIEKVLEECQKSGCQFVLVIIPSKNGPLYAQLKQMAELKVGIVTQCLTVKNITETNRFESVLGNVILKLNAKLNGINHVLQAPPEDVQNFTLFQEEAVMILGADVTHPSPTSANARAPSIAAVTASNGREGMKFMMTVHAQEKAGKNAAEVIVDLKRIVLKFIESYIQGTGTAPTKIIYYRDGVGSGQFKEVLHREMLAIREACTEAARLIKGANKYEPPITIITVQKRNKTRVFSQDGRQLVNAAAGTVIDEEITHPVENDFFIIPHQGVLGTSRPTRFHVLWDDSDFSNNQLQLMTYYLCYMYVRCNRAVRIPAPTYYAHWAAARAKILCEGIDSRIFDNLDKLNKALKRPEEFVDLYPMHFI